MGSRSILAGIIWLVLMGLAAVEGVETVIVLLERVGVVRLTAGRDDRSAGLMSGILAMVVVVVVDYVCMYWVLRAAMRCGTARGGRWAAVLRARQRRRVQEISVPRRGKLGHEGIRRLLGAMRSSFPAQNDDFDGVRPSNRCGFSALAMG